MFSVKIAIMEDECINETRKIYEMLITNLVTFHAANYKRAFYKDVVMEPSNPGLQNRHKSGIRVSKRQLDFLDKYFDPAEDDMRAQELVQRLV